MPLTNLESLLVGAVIALATISFLFGSLQMKLFLISQKQSNHYDTFDSAVVAALTAEDAKAIHPDGCGEPPSDWNNDGWWDWAMPEHVHAEHIGRALKGTQAGVICASFNAG